MLNTVYIGFDKVEEVAYHTLVASIHANASQPVKVVPMDRSKLNRYHHRPMDPKQSNSFTYVRFLVPYLENYTGWSLFMDCDMIVRDDINELFKMADEQYDVMCVQHPEYTSKAHVKYLGNVNHNYPRKNWSSVMLFNNAACRRLSTVYVDRAMPAELHRMEWANSIGNLPKEWNHLVGEFEPNPGAKIAHFTLGTPCWEAYGDCEFADEWRKYRALTQYYQSDAMEETG